MPTIHTGKGLLSSVPLDGATILQVVKRITPPVEKNGSWRASCPFHADETLSLMLDIDRNAFHCWECQQSGDVSAFIARTYTSRTPSGTPGIQTMPDADHATAPAGVVPEAARNDATVTPIRSKMAENYGTTELRREAGVEMWSEDLAAGVLSAEPPASRLVDIIERFPVKLFREREDEKDGSVYGRLLPQLLAEIQRSPSDMSDPRFVGWYADLSETAAACEAMLRVAIREHRIMVPELFSSRLEKATMTLRREAMARPDSRDFAVQAASRQTGIVIRTLGKRGDIHYFSSTMNLEIVALPSSAVSRPTSLFQLAPESFWMMTFGNNKGQVSYNSAASYLIQRCTEQDIFSPDQRIRGTGVWLDSGRVIHHLGSHLVVDGTIQSVRGFSDSKLFYEGTDSLLPDSLLEPGSAERLYNLKPLSDAEGAQIARAAELCEWEMEGMGMLVAGWIAVAILCASLKWRTHVWLTAPSQSGKSTLLEEFVLRLLDSHGLDLNGSTTESGLRQLLKRAALPVTIDEAEGETDQDRARIRSIMTSARSMTSGKGKTAKGTVGGTAVTFNPRSMLFLVSVAHDLSQAADTSRVVNLRLCKVPDAEVADRLRTRWAEQANILKQWDDEFVVRFWLRMSGLLPKILANTERLKEIIKARGGVRMGDVYAPLLAGYHALTRNDLLSEAEAKELVGKYFAVFRATGPESGAGNSDGGKVLTHLRHVPVVVEGRRIILAEAVSEVLRAQDEAEKLGRRRNEVICPADEELRRMGMRVVQKTFTPRRAGAKENITVIGLAVATMAPAVDEVFAKTSWAAPRWRTVLKQIPGVESTSERILDGNNVSVTLIPVERVRAASFAAMNEAAREEQGMSGIDAQLQDAVEMPNR